MNRILIVDDDPTLVDFLKLLLESEGYETSEATDGLAALEQIQEQDPEVVLLDYMMPNMDGIDVLRNVSKNYESSFVVMLTGKGSEEVAVECMKAGAVDYVVKPFDNDRLLSVVRNAVRFREVELQKRKLNAQLQELNQQLRQYITQALEMLQSNRTEEAIAVLTRARNSLK